MAAAAAPRAVEAAAAATGTSPAAAADPARAISATTTTTRDASGGTTAAPTPPGVDATVAGPREIIINGAAVLPAAVPPTADLTGAAGRATVGSTDADPDIPGVVHPSTGDTTATAE